MSCEIPGAEMRSLNLLGVYPVGPEHFLCALLHTPEQNLFLPIWLSPFSGGKLAALIDDVGPLNPSIYETYLETLKDLGAQVQAVRIASYYEGVFHAEVLLSTDSKVDTSMSDALLLAWTGDIALEVDPQVLRQAGIRISAADAKGIFDLDLPVVEGDAEDGSVSASGDPEADRDFEQLMKSLGADDLFTSDDEDGDGAAN
ncbi:bifunctional nuclease family protein [Corynebacterium sp. MC-17D]|uniref:Bifunctional nuclease family protein n=1 Tax=Corynebacterium lipophilum TaxID=2804918 RepID=A0AAW5HWM7_9CORY|nr:bifunctional nuclease domain-containing protein [Corynebacterium lipophilum]MCO6395182.1 bifunctional nuclease family protein [Corynebacterium lipophilum]MCZ2117853.1 bifunctional nuclease family protein [Corynebacterium lipophilum]